MPRTYDKDADNTPVVVKVGGVRIKSVHVRQRTFDAPLLFLKLFNDDTVTVATQAAEFSLMVPAGRTQVDCLDTKVTFAGKQGGMIFGTALTYAVTTLNTVSGTAPDADDAPEVIIQWEPLG